MEKRIFPGWSASSTGNLTRNLIAGVLTVFSVLPALAGSNLHLLRGDLVTKQVEINEIRKERDSGAVFDQQQSEYIVQFLNAITESDRELLRSLGFKIYRYMPDDALIVRGTHQQVNKARNIRSIWAVVSFAGDYKISPHFSQFSVFSRNQHEDVLITAFDAEGISKIFSAIQKLDPNVRLLDEDGRALAVQVSSSSIPSLGKIHGVEFIEPLNPMVPMHFNIELESNNSSADPIPHGDYSDLTGYETGTKVMNFDAIWSQGFQGDGQIVGMADTGLDSGDVQAILPDFSGAVYNGYAFGVGAKNWSDPMGHGTHVAGSVLGRGTVSGGKLPGGAPKAKIVAQGMWSPIIDNLTVPPKLAKLFDAAYSDGARIHTNSWGAARGFGAYDSMAQQVDEFMWNHPDFLILFAAGNSGVDANKDGVIDDNSIGSPGTAKDTLTVGASENLVANGGIQRKISELKIAKDNWPAEPIWSSKLSDNINGMAMFSSRGPAKDGRIKPEISAPGTNILSTKSSLLKPEDNFWGPYNKNYMYSGGTSMATPLVAGAAAVTREVLVKRFGMKNPSAAMVKATLLHTAYDMYPGQYGEGSVTQEMKTHRPNNVEGYGRVDMAALSALGDHTVLVDSDGISQGEVFEKSVEVKSGSLLVNLVYTDAPGTPSAGVTLVNDLDLVVKNAAGQVLSKVDNINPHEIFEAKNLPAGSYSISVVGTKIPMGKAGKQPFALVYSAQ